MQNVMEGDGTMENNAVERAALAEVKRPGCDAASFRVREDVVHAEEVRSLSLIHI